MANGSSIEWTEATWNPVTGCDRISPGCDHCYALRLAGRLQAMGSARYQANGHPATSGPGFAVTCHPNALSVPFGWRTGRMVFVNSMSDLFHARVPEVFVRQVFAVMATTPQHTYQVLTKRPRRMAHLANALAWPANVWAGVSVESPAQAHRIDALRQVPAAVRFVSAEPLLADLADVDLAEMHWLIIGGESGPGARPMHLDWVRHLIHAANDQRTAVFVKQLGSVWSRSGKGNDPNTWPTDLRVRTYPNPTR